jgi:signal transduction histidine kinase
MLTMAQIDEDAIRRGMRMQSSQDMADDLYCQYRCAAEGRGIALQIEDAVDFAFLGHEESVRTAFGNLVDNAIKFTPSGGQVTIGSDNRDGMVRLYVRDTGFGIPEARQDEVFQSFNRVGREGTDIVGVGLGLAIARRLTQAMDGRIGFSSAEGQGSTFWMDFPPPLV